MCVPVWCSGADKAKEASRDCEIGFSSPATSDQRSRRDKKFLLADAEMCDISCDCMHAMKGERENTVDAALHVPVSKASGPCVYSGEIMASQPSVMCSC